MKTFYILFFLFSVAIYAQKPNLVIPIGHTGAVTSVCFSSNGKYLLTGSRDLSAILWDLKGHEIVTYKTENEVRKVAISKDNNFVLTGTSDGFFTLWTIEGERLKSIPDPSAQNEIGFSNTGDTMFTEKNMWNTKLYTKITGTNPYKKVNQLTTGIDGIKPLPNTVANKFSPDKAIWVCGSSKGDVQVYSTKSKELKKFKAHEYLLNDVAIAQDGQTLVTVNEFGEIKQWNLNGKLIRKYTGHAQSINAACFSSDGYSILTAGMDKTAKLWDAFNNDYTSLAAHKDEVVAVDISNDKSLLLTGSADKTVKLWNTADSVIKTLTHDSKIIHAGFYSDQQHIFSCSLNGWIKRHSKAGKGIDSFKQRDLIVAAAISPDGKQFATVTRNKSINQYNHLLKPTKIITLRSNINCIAYTSKSDVIVSGLANGLLQLSDVKTGSGQDVYGRPGEEITAVACSKNGKYIASGNKKGGLQIWNTETKESVSIKGHQTKIRALQFSPKSNMVLSASMDGTTKLFDVITGEELLNLVSLGKEDWVVSKPNCWFDASTNGKALMNYVAGTEVLELEQIKSRYYEPGLLSDVLGLRKLITRRCDNLTGVDLYPEISAKIDGPMLLISLVERKGKIGRLSVSVGPKEIIPNANPDNDTKVDPIDLRNYAEHFTNDTNLISIKVYEGSNWLQSPSYDIFYDNSTGSRSTTNSTNTTTTSTDMSDARFFALCIGTSKYDKIKPLKLADFDAKSMANALQVAAARLYDDVEIKVLTSDAVGEQLSSKTNIQNAFESFRQKIKVNDVFLIYFSGHGKAFGEGDNSQFYYLTKELPNDDLADKNNLNYTVSSEELRQWLTNNYSRKQVLIFDVCHSGKLAEAFVSTGARDIAPSKVKTLDKLAGRTGLHILTGSAGDKLSYESSAYGQGLLTYSLLSGMSGLALNEKKEIEITRLFRYAEKKVPDLAQSIGETQKPIVNSAPNSEDFEIGIVDIPGMIKLPSPKPIMIRAQFAQEMISGDSIGLNSKFTDYFNDISSEGDESVIVYSDVSSYQGAYHIDGFYAVEGNKIKVKVNLKLGTKLIKTFPEISETTGDITKLPELCNAIFSKIFPHLKT